VNQSSPETEVGAACSPKEVVKREEEEDEEEKLGENMIIEDDVEVEEVNASNVPEEVVIEQRDNGMHNAMHSNCYYYVPIFSEFPLTNFKGEIIYFPNPTCELILKKDEVTDDEKVFHFDFFDGSGRARNPQRYLKIRNYILESW
jgi:hypothetical protein